MISCLNLEVFDEKKNKYETSAYQSIISIMMILVAMVTLFLEVLRAIINIFSSFLYTKPPLTRFPTGTDTEDTCQPSSSRIPIDSDSKKLITKFNKYSKLKNKCAPLN